VASGSLRFLVWFLPWGEAVEKQIQAGRAAEIPAAAGRAAEILAAVKLQDLYEM
jgi:hypothetical protein